MYDTGSSMEKLLAKVNESKPASVKVAVAFHKKTPKNVERNYFADYLGFLVPNTFVIGYGMDYNERFRDIFHLCEFGQKGIDKFAV